MCDGNSSKNTMVISYLQLRTTIGILGTALPFILTFGALLFFKTGLQNSLSSYYYTGMGHVFTGILCSIGFFMFSYKGYDAHDDMVGDMACLFAIGIALFPTAPERVCTDIDRFIGYVHLASAALFFITLIYFSLRLFTKTDPQKTPSRSKLYRNRVYITWGYIMAICILLIAVYSFLPDAIKSPLSIYKPVYWCESIAVIAFGISWLTKGEAILKDEE